jgi:acetyl esterase/lipase
MQTQWLSLIGLGLFILITLGCASATVIPPTPAPTIVNTATPVPAPTNPPATATSTPLPRPTATLESSAPKNDVLYVPGGDKYNQILDVYLPTPPSKAMPTLLLIHGGGESKSAMRPIAAQFTERGYAAVAIDFRANARGAYPISVQDAFCALAWIHTNAPAYGFDSQRVVAIGYSLGGTLAALLGTVSDPTEFMKDCPHALPKTKRLAGVVTLTLIADYSAIAKTSSALRNYANTYIGAGEAQAPELWKEASPIFRIGSGAPPFLVMHGAADKNITPDESKNYAAALEQAKIKVKLVIVPDADHASIVFNPQTLKTIENFLKELW